MISPLLKSISIIMFFILCSCSFVEDRSAEQVQIVDASDSRNLKPQEQSSSKPAKQRVTEYWVIKHDTLGIIAQKTMGAANLYRQLADFNSLDYREPLIIGQRLLIPQSDTFDAISSVQPLKRPRAVTSSLAQPSEFKDLDNLIEQQHYNQAIDWALTHELIDTNPNLQAKLIQASKLQADKEATEKDYSEALFLINGLINKKSLSKENKRQLTLKANQIKCQQLSYNALKDTEKNLTNPAYSKLLNAYQLDTNLSSSLNDFIKAREAVTESMHQQALKLYRNQQLDSALSIWDKILAIKPNDDLALVYKDRVNNLKKKLNDI